MLTTNLASSPWDIPANVDTLKQMWTDGHSASRIAARLGVTRNAVIRKVTRLKLPRHGSNNPPKPKAPPKPKGANRLLTHPLRNRASEQRLTEIACGSPRVLGVRRIDPDDGVDVTHLVKLVDLKHDSCRWPIGDPKEPQFGFCGAPAMEGKPYCPRHQRRTHVAVAE